MQTKREVLEAAARGEGCLGKAADDEPVFILRGQDLLTADTIMWWASRVKMYTGSPSHPKALAAMEEAAELREWQAVNSTRTKFPD